MLARLWLLVALMASAVLIAAAPAAASLATEVAAGRDVARHLQAGSTSCDQLEAADFEHLGEYVMDRMLGSRAAHEAMNARMSAMLGAANGERMHELMGRRYAGCATSGAGAMMAPGMMGGGPPAGGNWGAMMSARGYTWMHDGTWQHMSRAEWRRVGASWMGAGMMSGGRHDGWSTGAMVAWMLGGLLLIALIVALVVTRPWQRRPTPPTAA
jgi:hypothetical protein